jgi:hypothetical protein
MPFLAPDIPCVKRPHIQEYKLNCVKNERNGEPPWRSDQGGFTGLFVALGYIPETGYFRAISGLC